MAGFQGDPHFTTGTAGWAASGPITLSRADQSSMGGIRWATQYGGLIKWTSAAGYAGSEIRVAANDLSPGTWYYVQAYVRSASTPAPRMQWYTTTGHGTFQGNVHNPYTSSMQVALAAIRFRASATSHTLRLLNFDPTTTGNQVQVNGLLITEHSSALLDPSLLTSADGWTIYGDLLMEIRPHMPLAAPGGLMPRNVDGDELPLAFVTATANIDSFSRAAVFTKEDCVPGQVYQVLVRTLQDPASGILPIYLAVDDTQIAWAADKIDGDFTVLWGTFTATAASHQVKIVNATAFTTGQSFLFAGLEIIPVPTMLGQPLATTDPPHYPAKIQQTLYPNQPGFEFTSTPHLIRQMQYMKDVGITQLTLEQVVNMSWRVAYYDTAMVTPQTGTDPVTGDPVTLPALEYRTDLVDRIVEAAEAVGGIDLWWGIGRYWPWETAPTQGAGVTSTVDPGVSWTRASWTADTWGSPEEPGHGSTAEALAANALIVQELVARYGPHIKGWYIPLEIESVGVTWATNRPWLRVLFYELTKMCLAAKSGVPVMVSPFYQDLVPQGSADEYHLKRQYAEAVVYSYRPAVAHALANGATKFVLAQQDGLGDVDRSVVGSARIYHALHRALRVSDAPADVGRIELWHNIDLYDVHYNAGGPMDPQKLQDMMNAVNLLPARTSFSFASQLSPQRPTRRPAWEAYRRYANGKYAAYGALPDFYNVPAH